jgi:hypothetical protein
VLKLSKFILSSLYLLLVSSIPLAELAHAKNLSLVDRGKIDIAARVAKTRNRATEANACMEYSGGFVFAKTQKYQIEICGSKTQPLSYYISSNRIGDSKRADLVLDLQSYTFDRQVPRTNEKFIAVKGDTQYILTRTSVTVKRKNRVISTEKVIYYRRLT